MRTLKLLFSLVLVLVFFSCSGGDKSQDEAKNATSSDLPTLKVATDATYPPMEYTNENKELIGYDVEVISNIAKGMNVVPKIKSVVWDNIFTQFDEGKFDVIISSVSITAERKLKYDFVPYFTSGNVLLIRREDSSRIKGLGDIGKDEKVGAQNGTTGYTEILKKSYPNIKVRLQESAPEVYEDLNSGNIVAAVLDLPISAFYKIENDKSTTLPKLWIAVQLNEEQYGIVVKKGDTQMFTRIQNALDTFSNTEEAKSLKTKYGLAN